MQIPWNEFASNFQGTLQMGQKVIGFCGNLGYRLHPETISQLSADLLSTSHVYGCVPHRLLYPKLSEAIVFVLSSKADRHKR